MGDYQQRNVPSWSEQHETRVVPAVLAGGAAALVGGAIWAAIVAFANVEVGYVAWGIGLLVGIAMAATTPTRGKSIAALAAMLAAVGLVAGKTMIVKYATQPALVEEIAADEEWLAEAAAYHLHAAEALPVDLQERYDALAEDDTLSDALWAEMLNAGATHAASVQADERERIASDYADYLLSGIDFMTLFSLQMSLWDLLWFGLAITTAWKIMAREPKAEEMQA